MPKLLKIFEVFCGKTLEKVPKTARFWGISSLFWGSFLNELQIELFFAHLKVNHAVFIGDFYRITGSKGVIENKFAFIFEKIRKSDHKSLFQLIRLAFHRARSAFSMVTAPIHVLHDFYLLRRQIVLGFAVFVHIFVVAL